MEIFTTKRNLCYPQEIVYNLFRQKNKENLGSVWSTAQDFHPKTHPKVYFSRLLQQPALFSYQMR